MADTCIFGAKLSRFVRPTLVTRVVVVSLRGTTSAFAASAAKHAHFRRSSVSHTAVHAHKALV